MLLAIDARNRSVTVGLREGSIWRSIKRFGLTPERSADEYALLFSTLGPASAASSAGLGADGIGTPFAGSAAALGSSVGIASAAVDSAWIASVVPALTPRLVEAVASAFGVEAVVIGPGVRTGVKIRTDQPSELGADLVCAAAAAFEMLRGPCIVVDFGVALTLSAVNASGEFLGAAIAPGISAAAQALRASAAQLPEVRLDFPANAIGRNTASAIQSGILLGYEGLVQALVLRIQAELLADAGGSPSGIGAQVIGCGEAMGRRLLAACGYERFVPELVLEGLSLIASRALKK
jgi:type III pantothenate kinase